MWSSKKNGEEAVALLECEPEGYAEGPSKSGILKSSNSRRFLNPNYLFYTLFFFSVAVFIILYGASNWQRGAPNYSEYFTSENSTSIPSTTTTSDFVNHSEPEDSEILAILGNPVTSTENFTTVDNSTDSANFTDFTEIIYYDNCTLPVFDPWDEAIKPYMIDADKTKNCDKNRKPYTELVNGTWRVVQMKEGRLCKARCHELPDLTEPIRIADWILPGPTDCEFLEAVCWENDQDVYGYIHTQIISKKLEKPKIQNSEHPDVFVFLMDSLSSGMAKRSLPKTVEYMQNTLKAVHFPYLSQVGTRSQVNAVPLWFGKQVEAGTKVGGKRMDADWTEDEYCRAYMDDKPNIFRDFQEVGYTTAILDNWFQSTLTHNPDCKGFQHFYTNHTFYPFTYVLERSGEWITQQSLRGDSLCRERYLAAQEYFDQFVRAYPDRPKFTWSWFGSLAHDDLDGPKRSDEPFLAFFKRNFERFDDAFVIFMADHGFRTATQEFYKTAIGGFEKHNPFLSIAVPKKYRQSGIIEILKENSKRLQSHYDVRAMLLDILKYQPSSNFTDRSFLKIPDEKGHSLIRRQPNSPRNCQHLPIPQQYCICTTNSTDLSGNTQLADRLAQALLDHIHKKLDNYNLSSLCHRFKTQVVLELDLHESSVSTKSTYHISVKTESPAQLETLITENHETGELEFDEISRLDRYGTTADCSKSVFFTYLCYCRD